MTERSTIWLVQHCQSEHHVSDLTGGWTDTPLTSTGRQQAKALAQRIATEFVGSKPTIYSSDLLRASQTADEISRQLAVEVTIDQALRERNNGAATGKTKAWARENETSRPARGAGLDRRPFIGAETTREFYARVSSCLGRIIRGNDGTVLLVTHGGVVHAAIAWWLGMPAELYDMSSFATRAGSITTLGVDDWHRRALLGLGDTSHLSAITFGAAASHG